MGSNQQTALLALKEAREAGTTADAAQTTADQAIIDADAAQTTATDAETDAAAAQSTADTAETASTYPGQAVQTVTAWTAISVPSYAAGWGGALEQRTDSEGTVYMRKSLTRNPSGLGLPMVTVPNPPLAPASFSVPANDGGTDVTATIQVTPTGDVNMLDPSPSAGIITLFLDGVSWSIF